MRLIYPQNPAPSPPLASIPEICWAYASKHHTRVLSSQLCLALLERTLRVALLYFVLPRALHPLFPSGASVFASRSSLHINMMI
jgi:hypothetical protein